MALASRIWLDCPHPQVNDSSVMTLCDQCNHHLGPTMMKAWKYVHHVLCQDGLYLLNWLSNHPTQSAETVKTCNMSTKHGGGGARGCLTHIGRTKVGSIIYVFVPAAALCTSSCIHWSSHLRIVPQEADGDVSPIHCPNNPRRTKSLHVTVWHIFLTFCTRPIDVLSEQFTYDNLSLFFHTIEVA